MLNVAGQEEFIAEPLVLSAGLSFFFERASTLLHRYLSGFTIQRSLIHSTVVVCWSC